MVNCLGLGIIDTLISRLDTYRKAHLLAVYDGGQVAGVAWMTPPHPLGLTDMPDAALALTIDWASTLPDRPRSVVGPKAQSDCFRDRWTERTGARVQSTMEQRIYQAANVGLPFSVFGEMRVVDEGDQPLLEEWSMDRIPSGL